MKSKDPEMGLDFFYYLQDSGLTLILYVLTTLILPNIISADFLLYEHNKFNHFLITRMSSSLYHKKRKTIQFPCDIHSYSYDSFTYNTNHSSFLF
ncbi:hypothetical protein [Catenibacterium sp. RTP21428st1_D7_RTP21428_210409]|uniref:hypothetical protein n=1 Tax=unclassified Catenibacterium TaxID=2643636 RepID=UPI0032EB98BF